MIRSRRQNFASLPLALSSASENTHWNLSATMLSCPWSIWDSFRGIQSHTHNWSFGWITIKIHNKIKYLKVPTYETPHVKHRPLPEADAPLQLLAIHRMSVLCMGYCGDQYLIDFPVNTARL